MSQSPSVQVGIVTQVLKLVFFNSSMFMIMVLILNIATECKDLLSRLLTVKPKDRITLSELLDHPWLSLAASGASATLIAEPVPLFDVSSEHHHRILQAMFKFGHSASQVELSMRTTACDEIYATYRFLEVKLKKLGGKRRILPRTHSESACTSNTTHSPPHLNDASASSNGSYLFVSRLCLLIPFCSDVRVFVCC